jgi:cytochrome P450
VTSGHDSAASAGQFDPDDPAALEDPEYLYGDLRARCPVAYSDRYGGFWAVTRYRDIQRVMRDWATFTTSQGIIIPRNPASGRRPPLHYDPPEHTGYRRAINPVFGRDRLRRLEPTLRTLANGLLPEAGRTVEFYGEFCSPYTAAVACLVLNIPADLVSDFATHLESFEDAQRRRDHGRIEAENLVLYELCRAVVAVRQRARLAPEEDLVTALLAATVGGVPVTAEVAAGSLRQIVVAGHGAPALALASALLHLARDQALQQTLRARRDLLPAFAEEMLRLHTPNVGFARTATRDVELAGQTIAMGEPVAIVLPSANQDPAVFDRPGEVDLRRPRRHLAFGYGPHACPGSPVGRGVLVAGTEAVLARYQISVCDEPEFSPWPTAGPTRLPLRLS